MPIRKRMSPIARRARSKRRMRPKRRKKPPVDFDLEERGLEMRLGEGGENGRRLGVKGLIWGDLWGVFLEGDGEGRGSKGGERTYRLCRMLRRFLEGEG